ncbi:MAG TPA: KamA family radical SAM protein [Nitrospinota bacterium]|nr:KamA family radical SAM protein [Nitrospinota bacterium]
MKWENKLKENICSIEELKKHIKLTKNEEKKLQRVTEIYPINITKYYLSLINKNDKKDPLRKLIVPSEKELDISGIYDTRDEKENTKVAGLQHTYKQTALILSTNWCSAYCRFCFRKQFLTFPKKEIAWEFNDGIEYIKSHKEINNVLVSGGDPLILPTEIIENFLKKLSAVKHLNFIRFGSRIPVVFPDRILDDKSFLELLKKFSLKEKKIYIVVHFNHPREITQKSIAAVDKIIKSNVIVKNQTVLLKGINDNPDTLAELLNKLVGIGINPYYIFQCRPVKGAKEYFQVPLYRGYRIVENAKKKLDGLSKGFKYIMSHKTGKIEIVGVMGNEIYFKYHQAKESKNIGKFFKKKINKKAKWLDDL